MIIGTAGHIDHGKTSLVKALTGVDTDRLPEEKKRGISIELGYAWLDAPGGGRIAFVDVPGHERLVHTMLAGATGIDHALLLVAADDGPMPQTREHLAVLSLLGIGQGTVVVTKADRVGADRLAAACAEAAALLAGSALCDAPVLTVSAVSGNGMATLRQRLFDATAATAARVTAGQAFRLAVDRSFLLDGVGTVVTGTVHGGVVTVGDELVRVPAGTHERDRIRVRSVHAGNRASAAAHAGERCALGLAGIARDAVRRGDWLVAPAAALATDRIDVELSLWQGEAKALRSGTPVFVHLGAAAVQGSVALLDAEALAPGAAARAQLVLHQPIGAWQGDRFALRDASASRTLAGGRVLDPFAPARYRRTPQRLRQLDALAAGDAPALLAQSPAGLDVQRLQTAQARALPVDLGPAASVALCGAAWAIDAAHADAGRQAVLGALAAYHQRSPEELGPDAGRLRRLALPRWPEPLWQALLRSLVDTAAVVQRGTFVHLPEHGLKLSAVDERIAQKIGPRLTQAGFEGAWARDLARDVAESEPLMRVAIARLAQRGEVHQVVRDLVYPTATLQRLGRIARELAAAHGGEVTAAGFRDATQLGRKRAIQILEYLDRIGMLRRVGDVHRLRSDSMLFLTNDSHGR